MYISLVINIDNIQNKILCLIRRLDHDNLMYFDILKPNPISKLLHQVTIFFIDEKDKTNIHTY